MEGHDLIFTEKGDSDKVGLLAGRGGGSPQAGAGSNSHCPCSQLDNEKLSPPSRRNATSSPHLQVQCKTQHAPYSIFSHPLLPFPFHIAIFKRQFLEQF